MHRRIVLSLFILSLLFLCCSWAAAGTGKTGVILFGLPNYIGPSQTYSLSPEENHRIIRDLGSLRNKISSLKIGPDVAVILCANPPAEYQAITDLQASLTGYYETIKSTSFFDALLIYRAQQGIPPHIVLEAIGEKSAGAFTSHNPGTYYYFLSGIKGKNTLEVGRLPDHMNDNFDRLTLVPTKSESLKVLLYPHPQFMGSPLEFPGNGSTARIFPLWDFGLGDQVSSFILSTEPVPVVGGAVAEPKIIPIPPKPKSPMVMKAKPLSPGSASPLTQAQPAASSSIVQLAGSWNSSIHLPYEIKQEGKKISWFLPVALQKAKGEISGDQITVTWVDLKGEGGNSGEITRKDSSGRALEIRWKDGVVFYRE